MERPAITRERTRDILDELIATSGNLSDVLTEAEMPAIWDIESLIKEDHGYFQCHQCCGWDWTEEDHEFTDDEGYAICHSCENGKS